MMILLVGVSPMLSTWATALLLMLLILDRIRTYRRLAHIPGPLSGSFSKFWMIWANNSGRNHLLVAEVNAKYGSLARIGPNNLVTSDPDLIRRMNAPRSLYRRSDWYNTMRFKPRADNVLSHTQEERHDELRRKMAAGYSGKENPQLEESIDNRIHDLVNLIDRKYISGTELRKMDFGRVA